MRGLTSIMEFTYEQFARRANTYQYLDESLGAHTRFFAAAALTNRVLAELCVHRARWFWISCDSMVALGALGAILEESNLQRAEQIRDEEQSSSALDASLIEMEQATVESVLLKWAQCGTCRYGNLIADLNRILHAAAMSLPIRGSVSVRRYAQVLRLLAATLGRDLSFGSQSDRIRIGQALVEEARRA
jgi:hypothetical protein